MFRSRSSGRWSAESSAVAVSVKIVKLTTSPATIAYGCRSFPVVPPARITGSTGSTHGESAVTIPATNATARRSSIGPLQA